jgi:MTH538 TIR-like domain (DUF1863)
MDEPMVKNVFISHIHEDDHRLEPLKALLADNGIAARDSSITSEKPNRAQNQDYIMDKFIKPGIDWAGTMFVLISPDTKDHVWVDREIRYAVETNTPVVGIWDEGHHGCAVPEALEEFACAIVPWDAQHIIRAAFGEENEFLNADGTRQPPRSVPRADCG